MTQLSNIRQLLTDTKLGLLPHLDERLKRIEKSFQERYKNLQFQPYDLLFSDCNTLAANEPRPLITQSIALKLFMTASAEDKFELLLLASELQNTVDAAIFEWSNREWHQFEKPLKRPITQITGGLESEFLQNPTDSCRITIYREFDLTYVLTF
ncbi:MAG: hypothetical protein HXY43_05210 [Fischerella sp.]|jgi:hypothetical protein|uniref:hypothetical protein n=1 Tax=unclassified Fischerella TaxID=494603 RepID=UPI00047A0DEF|nr:MULTISPECIES: hypothetical protein [unclassified Fischerella]NWF58712.1 hypothetical protein [Fischerella sp.]